MDKDKNIIQKLFDTAHQSADPTRLIQNEFPSLSERIKRVNKVFLLGAGKAALEMTQAVYEEMGDKIFMGAIACVPSRLNSLPHQVSRNLPFEVYPANHPLPDQRNLLAANKISTAAEQADSNDLVLLLLSGGGSAHLCLPVSGLSLPVYQSLIENLLKAGAPIQEINIVRKHLEQLKGGGLLRKISPARVHTCILSDVIGDPLNVIASGPTAADPTTFEQSWQILKKYGIRVPAAAEKYIQRGRNGLVPETIKEGNPLLKLASYQIIGNNYLATQAVRAILHKWGYLIAHYETDVAGEAREVGRRLGRLAGQLAKKTKRATAIIMGGETTVTVQGEGQGGRNQELVLAAAIEIQGLDDILIASFATDGMDGPTPAAGSYATGYSCQRAHIHGMDPLFYLENNDSWNFFRKLGSLLNTGPTGTNVNDISIALINPVNVQS
ncbi:MAG: glycerate kinase [Chloroflexota bacterium]|nr:MAG: glycerate kinase [Chloroflexota bacterium]HDD61403.1 DUF4147 domain-containing protein [Chloroflexota bacterium]